VLVSLEKQAFRMKNGGMSVMLPRFQSLCAFPCGNFNACLAPLKNRGYVERTSPGHPLKNLCSITKRARGGSCPLKKTVGVFLIGSDAKMGTKDGPFHSALEKTQRDHRNRNRPYMKEQAEVKEE
jgi:hypothetical protein